MKVKILFILSFVLYGQISYGQKLDTTVYLNFLRVDKIEFVTYAKSIGYKTSYDSTTNSLFAGVHGILFTKPVADTGNEDYYLHLIVSTLDKGNNKLILKNTKKYLDKEGY